jgi:hypothetical protein
LNFAVRLKIAELEEGSDVIDVSKEDKSSICSPIARSTRIYMPPVSTSPSPVAVTRYAKLFKGN